MYTALLIGGALASVATLYAVGAIIYQIIRVGIDYLDVAVCDDCIVEGCGMEHYAREKKIITCRRKECA